MGLPPASNTFRFLGNAERVLVEEGAIEIVSGDVRIQIMAIHHGVFRIRIALHKDQLPVQPPFSYAIDPQFEAANSFLSIREDADSVVISDGTLGASVSLKPIRLTFEDQEGNRIAEDELGFGWLGHRFNIWKRAAPGDRFYGLGEKAYGLDRTGRFFTNWNTDQPGYAHETDPLYKSIPFFIVLTTSTDNRRAAYGVFLDNTYRSYFDFGGQAPGRYSFGAEGGEAVYYVLAGPDVADVIRRYTLLTGRTPLPPLWSLGYHQSRWSYYPESEVRLLVQQFRSRRIPLDVVHLDIHHLDGYRVFTWDPERFPDPGRLLSDLREQGVHVVTIVDPGIKIDPRYHVCARGLDEGAFVTYPDGSLYEGNVWPGPCYFPDFTNPKVREWFGGFCKEATQSGVAGFWTDMNEPCNHSGRALPDHVLHDLDGQGGTHLEAHNAYGLLMARSSFEGAKSARDDSRPFVLTRAAYAGAQRYACVWTGDNVSSWEHLELVVPMLLSLGLSGIPFSGSDVGGFFGSPSPELFVRWMQLGAFQPLYRNHTIQDSPRQEPWSFGEAAEQAARRAIELRYRLLPLMYTLFHEHTVTGLPSMRPLLLHYPHDPAVLAMDDEFLLGDKLLVAPILRPGTGGRQVYIPEGDWYTFESADTHRGPLTLMVRGGLSEIPMFVEQGTVLPLAPVLQHTHEREIESLALQVYPGLGISQLYEDDGLTTAYAGGAYRLHTFELHQPALGRLNLTHRVEGNYSSPTVQFDVDVVGRFKEAHALADGKPVRCVVGKEHARFRVSTSFRALELDFDG